MGYLDLTPGSRPILWDIPNQKNIHIKHGTELKCQDIPLQPAESVLMMRKMHWLGAE